MRQEKRHADAEHGGRGEQRAVGDLPAPDEEPDADRGAQAEREERTEQRGAVGGDGREVDQRVQGGGVVVESVADRAGIIIIECQKLPKIPSGEHGGQDREDVRQREYEQVAQLYAPCDHKYEENRQQEYALQLEGDADRDSGDAPAGPVVEHEVYAQHRERGVDHVALAPQGAVQYDRRQPERADERDELSGGTLREHADETQNGPGEDHVEENAGELHEQQLVYAARRDDGEEVEVGDVVVAAPYLPAKPGPRPRLAQGRQPHMDPVLIVERLIRQAAVAQHKRERHKPDREDAAPACLEKTLPPEDGEREQKLRVQQQGGAIIQGRTPLSSCFEGLNEPVWRFAKSGGDIKKAPVHNNRRKKCAKGLDTIVGTEV